MNVVKKQGNIPPVNPTPSYVSHKEEHKKRPQERILELQKKSQQQRKNARQEEAQCPSLKALHDLQEMHKELNFISEENDLSIKEQVRHFIELHPNHQSIINHAKQYVGKGENMQIAQELGAVLDLMRYYKIMQKPNTYSKQRTRTTKCLHGNAHADKRIVD